MQWLILIFGILSNASASVLVKIAMTPPRRFPTFSDQSAALSNWPFWLGLCLYGFAFVLYAAALSRFPLHIAHPILTSGAIATVAIFSIIFFHESFRLSTWAGLAFIVIGVGLLTARSQ